MKLEKYGFFYYRDTKYAMNNNQLGKLSKIDYFISLNTQKLININGEEVNNIKFDAIYIDGYHKGSQVFKDFKNSWQILNVGGILIFDDYIWKFFSKIEDNPCYVINKYLNEIRRNIQVLKVSNSQLFIQKID